MIRRWGTFTDDSGVFFELDNGDLFGVVRTTNGGVTTDDRFAIRTDATGNVFDLSKGNVFDIQYQWRGVGNYVFFVNLHEVRNSAYLGELTKLSMYNPALPLAFESINEGANDKMIVGCVDVSAEGGSNNGKTYGSMGIESQAGSVSVTGYNIPILVVRSKQNIGTLINTRDTLALYASAYGDNNAIFRVWKTRDATAITLNNQTWTNYRDGHLEYIVYDTPDVASPMAFNTAKASETAFLIHLSGRFLFISPPQIHRLLLLTLQSRFPGAW